MHNDNAPLQPIVFNLRVRVRADALGAVGSARATSTSIGTQRRAAVPGALRSLGIQRRRAMAGLADFELFGGGLR
jgi:hypothetical protein